MRPNESGAKRWRQRALPYARGTDTFDSLPRDLAAAHALILAERTARLESEERAAHAAADLIHAQATASSADALIARLRLEIEKLRRTLYGARSERKERLIDQLEMQLEDAEADATEDELAAERSAPSTLVKSFERKRPARKPFPEHLPRERVVIAAPTNCPCCGSTKLSKLGEDVTETLAQASTLLEETPEVRSLTGTRTGESSIGRWTSCQGGRRQSPRPTADRDHSR